jgi:hypothetical protein
MRFALAVALAVAASAASAQPVAPTTTLYADALGPTGTYALGAEHAVLASADGARQLRLRAGAAFWTEQNSGPDRPADRVVAVPVGAAALFSLGRPLGVPAAFEFGGGAVVEYDWSWWHSRFAGHRGTTELVGYAEAGVRAAIGRRAVVRAGVATGMRDWRGRSQTRPVFGVGLGL